MAKVIYNNLISEPRTNVLNLISNKTNVADPVTSSAEFRKWIYSREPDVKDSNFSGYPFIILHPAIFDPSIRGNIGGKTKVVDWQMEIEIVTSDRGYGGKDGLGLIHNDSITNDILETLMNAANRITLRNFGMSFADPTVSGVTTEAIADELVYRRVITLTFTDRRVISV